MKVLITAPSLDENKNVSGISTVVRQIIENGTFEYSHFQAGSEDELNQGLNWLLKQFRMPFRFFRAVRAQKPDIVHINTALNPLSIIRDLVLVKAARLAKRPVLLHIHGGRFLSEEFKNRWLRYMAKALLSSANAVIVLSGLEKTALEKRFPIVTIRVLVNAVEVVETSVGRSNNCEPSIIFMGRLHESKGMREIIETSRILVSEGFQFCFNCFGTGPMKDVFVKEMSGLLSDSFFYGGVIAGREKHERLSQSSIFLLPSRYGEGLPMALLEAMAAGCVVIASEMASVGEVISDGVNGFLVKPGDIADLTAKLRMVLSGNNNLDELRQNARSTIEDRFDLVNFIKRLEKMYEEIQKI